MNWMDEKGIRQWNVTDYLAAYPKSYYQEQQTIGNLYVLVFIHNLVTDPKYRGAGKQLLSEIEKLAVRCGKQFVRLDCAVDNVFLNRYYESFGYKLSGTCIDGVYAGNRREKRL